MPICTQWPQDELGDTPPEASDGTLDTLIFRKDIKAVEVMCCLLAHRRKHSQSWHALLELFKLIDCLLEVRCPAFPTWWGALKEKLAGFTSVGFRFNVVCKHCMKVQFFFHTLSPPKKEEMK